VVFDVAVVVQERRACRFGYAAQMKAVTAAL
jgi:hypothetical protein